MQEHELSLFKNWFYSHAAGCRSNDSEMNAVLDLKIKHTDFVCSNALRISQGLGWPEEQTRAAQIAALLHDVGRFPQMTGFQTFNDNLSCDHAALGVEIILTGGLLQNLTGKEQRQILSAVAWHNKRILPQELPKDEQSILRLVRDADKLDIMRIFCEYYAICRKRPNPLLEFGLPLSGKCSEKVIADLTSGRIADLADARNVNDVRLIKLSWIYDLHYPMSRALFLENKYIEKTLAALPPLPEVVRLGVQLTDYLKKNI